MPKLKRKTLTGVFKGPSTYLARNGEVYPMASSG